MTLLSSTDFLELGHKRFEKVSEEQCSDKELNGNTLLSRTPGTWEVSAVILDSNSEYNASREFLNMLKTKLSPFSNYCVWSFDEARNCQFDSPRVFANSWENFAKSNNRTTKLRHEYFNIFDPKGRFYHIQSSDDDLFYDETLTYPGCWFDIHLPFIQCVRAIEIIQKIAPEYERGNEDRIELSFRWKGLANRRVASWLCKESFFDLKYKAYQDDKTVNFSLTRGDKLSELFPLIRAHLLPLYNLFEGFEPEWERIEHAIEKYFPEQSQKP